MDGITELVFFRLCMISYEQGSPVVTGSDRRNSMRCKVDVDQFIAALEVLQELQKVTLTDEGIMVLSTKKRLQDSSSRMMARQRGAAIARRKRELKQEGRSSGEIDLIIKKEFPDHQSRIQTIQNNTDNTEQDTQGGVGGLFGDELPENQSDLDAAKDIWNAMAGQHGLSKVQVVKGTRLKRLRARLKDCGGVEGWKVAVSKVPESEFLLGKVNGRKWKADFDFLCQESSFIKVMEDRYKSDPNGGGSPTMQAIRGR